MTNYDSVLKEKKNYEVVNDNDHQKFPTFKIVFLISILILIISYIIYFMTILTPNMIFFNDINIVFNKYKSIFNSFDLDNINNIEGNIKFNDNLYNFSLNKDNNIVIGSLSLNEDTINYFSNSNLEYLKLSNYDNIYYKLNNMISAKTIYNIKEYFTKIPDDKFIKKVYLDKTRLVVESNLVLNKDDVKVAFGLDKIDAYEVLFTLKNNAFTNEVISMKITINNLSLNKRSVITYENGYLNYKDDNYNLKFILDDDKLQIYKDDILYSVLRRESKDKVDEYIYQVIDKGYNLNFNISNNEENVSIIFTSKILENESIITRELEINYNNENNIINKNIDIEELTDYSSLPENEMNEFTNKLNNIINPLREFIDKHKYSIN